MSSFGDIFYINLPLSCFFSKRDDCDASDIRKKWPKIEENKEAGEDSIFTLKPFS